MTFFSLGFFTGGLLFYIRGVIRERRLKASDTTSAPPDSDWEYLFDD
jgi:hypothetical protein